MFSQDHNYVKNPDDDVEVGSTIENSITRCNCGFQDDDDFMIQCGTCLYVSSSQFLDLNLFILSFFDFTANSVFS